MLIVGAKGFAKELLQHFHNNNETENLYFFDDVSDQLNSTLFGKYKILKNIEDAKKLFDDDDNRYTLGLGNPYIRHKMFQKMNEIGGKISSTIATSVEIGSYNVAIGAGVNIMSGTIITNDIKIGDGVLINLNCTIGHDSVIGDFCELNPGVHVSGHVTVGKFTALGTGCVIIPKVKVGENCIIGAGSVVNRDIPDYTLAVGVPAKVIKTIEPSP